MEFIYRVFHKGACPQGIGRGKFLSGRQEDVCRSAVVQGPVMGRPVDVDSHIGAFAAYGWQLPGGFTYLREEFVQGGEFDFRQLYPELVTLLILHFLQIIP